MSLSLQNTAGVMNTSSVDHCSSKTSYQLAFRIDGEPAGWGYMNSVLAANTVIGNMKKESTKYKGNLNDIAQYFFRCQ